MGLTNIIETILKEQKTIISQLIPVDVKIANGNIFLKYFHIVQFDKKQHLIKGITFQERYIHVREEREPVYCYITLREIKELHCPYLDLHFVKDQVPVSIQKT